jgi:hypothetical protein
LVCLPNVYFATGAHSREVAVASFLFSFSLFFFFPSSVLLPSYCSSSALAAINQEAISLHVNSFILISDLWRAVCKEYRASGKAKCKTTRVHLDAVGFCAAEALLLLRGRSVGKEKIHEEADAA